MAFAACQRGFDLAVEIQRRDGRGATSGLLIGLLNPYIIILL
jgi:hypothetical protein